MELVRLTVVGSEAEAELACGALRAAGIECAHRPAESAPTSWQGSLSTGPAEVVVREEDLAAARDVLGETAD